MLYRQEHVYDLLYLTVMSSQIYNVNGEYYATDNFCPHRGAPLSEGAMFGHVVECGLHGWQFDVRNGECLTVRERIKTFAVKTRDGVVFVDLQQSL
jgi:nitrite reductase/ring-hydroxylating ferredoxin subunit